MDGTRAFLSLANEETARLKVFEAFMRGRVELEQQTISGLQALLEGVPVILDSKLLWHHALQKLLDGTREELDARKEELERLKDQMQAVGMSVAKAEIYIRDINSEFETLEPPESVDSAQAATATLHKDWFDIQNVRRKNGKPLKAQEAREAYEKYYKQDLTYRRKVHQQRQTQEFLNSIPNRVQEYGTKYWDAVSDVGTVVESFADSLRNISSICNRSGSTLWESAKNIKPLVDANHHTGAIDIAYHQSPTRLSPIHYLNPGSKSRSPSGHTILFGCPLDLHTVGELKKIPPVLEYLLDSVHDWPKLHPLASAVKKCWPLANELEQAWTGVEETDRAIISKLAPDDHRSLIMGYLMALPTPLWSNDDVDVAREVVRNPSSLIWNTWSENPTKLAVLRAIVSCQVRIGQNIDFSWDMVQALAQEFYFSPPGKIFMSLSKYPDFWRAPVNNDTEENPEAS